MLAQLSSSVTASRVYMYFNENYNPTVHWCWNPLPLRAISRKAFSVLFIVEAAGCIGAPP